MLDCRIDVVKRNRHAHALTSSLGGKVAINGVRALPLFVAGLMH